MEYILIGIALLTVVILTVVAHRKGEAKGLNDNETDEKEKNAALLRELSFRDHEVLNLQAKIDTLNDLNGSYLTFMFSFPADAGTIKGIISLADTALYQAKSAGRNKVMTHKPFLFLEAGATR